MTPAGPAGVPGPPARRGAARLGVRIAIAALAVMFVLRALLPTPRALLEASPTSYGTGPRGHGALFELLSRVELVKGRTRAAAQRLPAGATIWWIEPEGVCNDRRVARGGLDPLDEDEIAWPVLGWVRAGGTALVLLGPGDEDAGTESDAADGGPGAGRAGGAGGADRERGAPRCDAIGDTKVPARGALTGSARYPLEGLAATRQLELDGARVFLSHAGWSVDATLQGQPFVIEREIGDGRLVLVADARFLRNEELDRADAAPVAGALVQRFGVPWIDEREHGWLPETNPFRYLLHSAAAPVFLGLLVAGLLVAWRGSALPARSVAELDPATPTLDTFVASLASHYAATRDWERLHARYRELSAARLRRHFGWPPELGVPALVDRIASRHRGPTVAAGLRSLASPRPATSHAELQAAMLTLDALVEEVARR